MEERKKNMEYNSIFELDDVLNDLHIDHIFRPMWDGFEDPVGHLDVFSCLEYLSERRLLRRN